MIYGTRTMVTNGLVLNLDSVNPKSLQYLPTINYGSPSENFTLFPWVLQNGIVSGNTTNAPDGTLTADLYIPNTTSTQHRCFFTKTISHPFSFSVYAKPAGYNFMSLGVGGGLAGESIIFNLSGGTISGSGSSFTPYMEFVGDGWYRCGISYSLTGIAQSFAYFIIPRNDNTVNNYSGDSVSGIYVWGSQLEIGTTVTPYVKALTGLGFRNTWFDISGNNIPISMTGITFNQSNNSLFYSSNNPSMASSNVDVLLINFSGTPFTHELMVKLPNSIPASSKYLITKGTNSFTLYLNNNNLYIGKDLVSDWIAIPLSTYLGGNLHIVSGWDGLNKFCYLNGVLVDSSTQSTSLIESTSSPLTIGTNTNRTSFFDGNIYFYRIYNRSLSQIEINQNFNAIRGRFNI